MQTQQTVPDYPSHGFAGEPHALPEGPVARVRLPSGSVVWLVTGYEEVRAALAQPVFSRELKEGDPRVGSAGVPGGPVRVARTLQSDGSAHLELRRLAARPFTPRRIEALRERVQELTDGYLDAMEASGAPADLVAGLAYPLPITVIADLLAVPEADRPRFAGLSDTLVTVLGVSEEEADAARAGIQRCFGELIAARREVRGDDVISGWLTAAEEDGVPLTDGEVARLAQTVLVGGYETTVNTIGAGMWRLFQHPEQLAALRDDPGLIRGAVEEILRHQPQGSFFLILVAREDVELGGVTIREGEGVMPLPYAANRDPARFPDPDRFDILRPPVGHVTFGYGPHACLGSALARIELEVTLTGLLRRFPRLRPVATDLNALPWRHDRLVCGLKELYVDW
ncbi:cytochrome P450 [Streptomyces yaizuensis]|uniref:Cytochrome P450 n=1 Tax=Streptomyces yaizuensis TaxID=2989713 RepID=A0ABQ5NWU1_9ACTN|nr:cytochrome P450 [Streptomyces sp. YSPA8]GLF94655.1 cytochrome P450 [Streptomyces sp. YSPA8]